MEKSSVLSPLYQQQSMLVFSHGSVRGDGHYFQGKKPFLFSARLLEASPIHLKLYGSVHENGRLVRST